MNQQLLNSILMHIVDAAIDDAYDIAAENDSPNSPDFDRVLQETTDMLEAQYTRELIDALKETLA